MGVTIVGWFAPTAGGVMMVIVSARLPNTSNRVPSGLNARNRAPSTGISAEIVLLVRFNISTSPGGRLFICPLGGGAVGTAAKPVALSVETAALCDAPGRAMEVVVALLVPPTTLSVELSTTANEVFDPL